MTILELRTQIHHAVDKAQEDILRGVLDYLNQAQEQSHEQIRRDNNFKRIITEDENLLRRLAK